MKSSEKQNQEPKVKSLAKALNILSLFTAQKPVWGVTELAEQIGVAKSNVHNILDTFTSQGYLKRLRNGQYTLGLKMLEFAFAINQSLGYPSAIFDLLTETASRTGEIVYFGLPYGTNVLYLYVVHPQERLGQIPYRDILGETSPMYCTGIGKAILANLPEIEWKEHIPEKRVAYQKNTLINLSDIIDELRLTRLRGYSIDNIERDANVRCVGVPIYNALGKLVAGMSASGPAAVMNDEKLNYCAGILQESALKIAKRIYR